MRKLSVIVAAAAALAGCKSAKGPEAYKPTRTQAASTFAAISSKRVLEAAMHYPNKDVEPVQQVPMSLTASDGTGLKLVALQARAVVQGPLAFTELHLSFHNPESRVREGRFSITLPPAAAISRFAMRLPSGWQEAEVVERQAARQIYEDFLHRKQDPALLEKKAGNQFRARIFPIPANGTKEIKISYSQKLTDGKSPYRLHLRGLPKIDKLQITAMVGEQVVQKSASSLGGVSVSHKVIKVDKSNWAPDRDFEVAPQSSIVGLRHGNLALVRVTPKVSGDKAPMKALLVLVDSSASRAAGFYRQVEQLGALIKRLEERYGAELPLHVACFDQVIGSVYQGPIGQFGRQDLDAILARRPMGASDLHGALSWAGKLRGTDRLLLVTDGIATSGETDGAALRDAVKQLSSRFQRLDVLLVGGIRDDAAMKQLATGSLERDGVVQELGAGSALLAKRLSHKTVSGIHVSVPGAKWIWPKRLDGVQPGDSALAFVDLPTGALEGKPLTVVLGGPLGNQRHSARLAQVKRPLLERAWVEARIAHLQQQRDSGALGPDLRDAIVKQIIKLSTEHRVLSDYTALLVLETEQDYARYNIKRTALAEILVVGASGVELLQRGQEQQQPVMPVIRQPPPPRPPSTPPPFARRTEEERESRGEGGGEAAAGQAAPAGPVASADRAPSPAKSVATARPPLMKAKKREARPRPMPRPKPRPAPQAAPAPPAAEPEAPRARRSRSAADFEDDVVSGELARPDGNVIAQDTPTRHRRRLPMEFKLPDGPPALSGKVAEIIKLIKEEQVEQALVAALRWRAEQPGNVMALIALGEALQAHGNIVLAARVYGSIIDLFPSRADMRRFAGERLEALGRGGLDLAADTYGQAVKQRPDHALGHRLHALALLRQGEPDKALSALEAGVKQRYRINRRGVLRILREDLGLVAAAIAAKEPNRRAELDQRLGKLGASVADQPSLRFVLTWETDANDVDFHITDAEGNHASYRNKSLSSGGTLYADVTNGYGPECFAIPGKAEAYPYRLFIHYYSRGPMGYGMGKLQVVQHDGKGGLAFEDRPFLVMNDKAYVDLGPVKGPL